MAGAFTLTINTSAATTSAFGETEDSERQELAYLLTQVIQAVQGGSSSAEIIDQNGVSVGSYSYGVGTINAGA